MSDQFTIEVFGDRQVGKSYLLMLAAVDAAQQGQRVLYDTGSRTMARERFLQLEQHLQRLGILVKTYRSSGSERLYVESGGAIYFGEGRGTVPDLHIIDGAGGMPNPAARRVIRSHCTERPIA